MIKLTEAFWESIEAYRAATADQRLNEKATLEYRLEDLLKAASKDDIEYEKAHNFGYDRGYDNGYKDGFDAGEDSQKWR